MKNINIMNFLYIALLIILCHQASSKLKKKTIKISQPEMLEFENQNDNSSNSLYNFQKESMSSNQIRCLNTFSEVLKTLQFNLQIILVNEFKNSSDETCCDVKLFTESTKKYFNQRIKEFTKKYEKEIKDSRAGLSCLRNSEIFKKSRGIKSDKNKDNKDKPDKKKNVFLKEFVNLSKSSIKSKMNKSFQAENNADLSLIMNENPGNYTSKLVEDEEDAINEELTKSILVNERKVNSSMLKCIKAVNTFVTTNLSFMCLKQSSTDLLFVKNSESKYSKPKYIKEYVVELNKVCSEFSNQYTKLANNTLNSYFENINDIIQLDECNYYSSLFTFDPIVDSKDKFYPNNMKLIEKNNQMNMENTLNKWETCAKNSQFIGSFSSSNLKYLVTKSATENPNGLSTYIGRLGVIDYDLIKKNFPIEKYPELYISCKNKKCSANCDCSTLTWKSDEVIKDDDVSLDLSCCDGVCIINISMKDIINNENVQLNGSEVFLIYGNKYLLSLDELTKLKLDDSLRQIKNSSKAEEILKNSENYINDIRLATILNLDITKNSESSKISLKRYFYDNILKGNSTEYGFSCNRNVCTEGENVFSLGVNNNLTSTESIIDNNEDSTDDDNESKENIFLKIGKKPSSKSSSSKSSSSKSSSSKSSSFSSGSKSSGSSLTSKSYASSSTKSNGSTSTKSNGSSLANSFSGSNTSKSNGSSLTNNGNSGTKKSNGSSLVNNFSNSGTSGTNKSNGSSLTNNFSNSGTNKSNTGSLLNNLNNYGSKSNSNNNNNNKSNVNGNFGNYNLNTNGFNSKNSKYNNSIISTQSSKGSIGNSSFTNKSVKPINNSYSYANKSSFNYNYYYPGSLRNYNRYRSYSTINYNRSNCYYNIILNAYECPVNSYSIYSPSYINMNSNSFWYLDLALRSNYRVIGFNSYYYRPANNFYYYNNQNYNGNNMNYSNNNNKPNSNLQLKSEFDPTDWIPNYSEFLNENEYLKQFENNKDSLNLDFNCNKYSCILLISKYNDGIILKENKKRIYLDVIFKQIPVINTELLDINTKLCLFQNLSKLTQIETNSMIDVYKECGIKNQNHAYFPIKNSCMKEFNSTCKNSKKFSQIVERMVSNKTCLSYCSENDKCFIENIDALTFSGTMINFKKIVSIEVSSDCNVNTNKSLIKKKKQTTNNNQEISLNDLPEDAQKEVKSSETNSQNAAQEEEISIEGTTSTNVNLDVKTELSQIEAEVQVSLNSSIENGDDYTDSRYISSIFTFISKQSIFALILIFFI